MRESSFEGTFFHLYLGSEDEWRVHLLNEDSTTIAIASQAGFRCFTDASAFRRYVETEVLGEVSN